MLKNVVLVKINNNNVYKIFYKMIKKYIKIYKKIKFFIIHIKIG